MRRAVYISRSLIGPDRTVLADILAVSQARNATCGVTGMLWWSSDTFAQALEGDDQAVGETLRRIDRDARHTDIGMVEDVQVPGRLFGQWSMFEADGGQRSTQGTAYLVGYCATQPGREARRLFDFLVDAGY